MSETPRKQSIFRRKGRKFWLIFVVTPIMVILCSLLGAYSLYKLKGLSARKGVDKGRIYLRLDKNNEAIDIFNEEIVKNPGNADIYYYMGIAYFRLKEYDKAIDSLKASLKIKPDFSDASLLFAATNLQIALELRKLGESETLVLEKMLEAESVCDGVLKVSPDSVRAHIQLGQIHAAMGFYEDAIIEYIEVLKIDNTLIPAHIALIKLYMKQKSIDLIKKHCKNILEIDNSLIPVHIELIKIYLVQKNMDLAIKQCKEVLSEIEPDNYPIQLLLSSIYEKQGTIEKAVASLNKILEKKPADVTAHVRLGLINLKMSKYDEALFEAEQTYITSAETIPPAVNFIKGSVSLQKRDYKNAEEEFSKLLQSNYTFQGYFNIAKVYLAQGDFDKCIEHCNSGIEIKPDDVKIRYIMGLAYMKKGWSNKAALAFNNIINTNPDFIPSYLKLTSIMKKLKQYSIAEQLCKTVLKLKPDMVEAHVVLGNIYILMGKKEDAISKLEVVEEEYAENNAGIYIALAKSYMALGKGNKAEILITKALGISPGNVKLLISIANIYLGVGNDDKAKVLIMKAMSLEPKNPIPKSLLAKIHLKNERISDAIIQLKLTLLDNPKFIDAYKLGILYIDEGEYNSAALVYKTGLEHFPDNFLLWCNLSITYILQEDYKGAEDACLEALKIEKNGVMPNLCMLNTLMVKGDFSGAKQSLQNTSKLNDLQKGRLNDLIEFCDNNRELTKKIVFHSSRAMAFASSKWLKRSLREYEEITRILPLSAFAYQQSADILLLTGQREKAIEIIKKIIELEPETLNAYGKLAGVYILERKIDDAEALYRKMISIDQNSVAAHLNLGILLQSKDLIKEAMDEYNRAIELDPSSIKAYNNLAWLHATQKLGKVDVALKLAKKAKELSPDPAVIDTLGWIYYLNGMYDEAVFELEASVKGAPWNSTILYHLGMAYYKNEQREQALDEFERALKINSNFPEAKEASKLIDEIRTANDTE